MATSGILKRNYLKETAIQVFQCEYCEIFVVKSFSRTPPAASFNLVKTLMENTLLRL